MTDREALAALLHDAWREGYTDGPASLEWIAAYLAERGVTLAPSLDERLRGRVLKVVDDMENWRNRNPNARLGRWAIRDLRAALAQEGETP